MAWIVVFALILLLILQAMHSLSGARLLVTGLLGIGLLWPVSKWVLKGEVAHQVAHVVTQKVTEPSPSEMKGVPKPSVACRIWNKLDGHKKNGLVRDRIRQSCDVETFE